MEKRVEITIMMIIKVKTKHNRTCLLGAAVCATVQGFKLWPFCRAFRVFHVKVTVNGRCVRKQVRCQSRPLPGRPVLPATANIRRARTFRAFGARRFVSPGQSPLHPSSSASSSTSCCWCCSSFPLRAATTQGTHSFGFQFLRRHLLSPCAPIPWANRRRTRRRRGRSPLPSAHPRQSKGPAGGPGSAIGP